MSHGAEHAKNKRIRCKSNKDKQMTIDKNNPPKNPINEDTKFDDSDPFELGFNDALKEGNKDRNPYEKYSREWNFYQLGWMNARSGV
jgi:hypothetical protein